MSLPWSWGGAGEFVLETAVVIGRAAIKQAFPESWFGGAADGVEEKQVARQSVRQHEKWPYARFLREALRLASILRTAQAADRPRIG